MKRLVVCFDGTWNAADSERAETNVARMARAVRANSGADGVQQLVFYERGVGTTSSSAMNLFAGATGLGVGDTIRSAYRTLAQNYVPGDEIFVFGFSRGAFSARSLSGLIGACGLLKRQNLDHVHRAWSFYREAKVRTPEAFALQSEAQTHTSVEIKFLGVWDTVGALGVPVGLFGKALMGEVFEFHDTSPSRIVRYGAHALAIDEYRDEFVPTLWTGSAPQNSTIEQVWFCGCHSDVGGGYQDRRMANIPLRWMALRAESQGLQLDWDCGALPDRSRPLDALAPLHDPRDGFSTKDLLTPTIRRICGAEFEVSAFEKLFVPRDKKGRMLNPIGEHIHRSVTERWDREDALLCLDDVRNKTKRGRYRAKNISALFNDTGSPLPNVSIADDNKFSGATGSQAVGSDADW